MADDVPRLRMFAGPNGSGKSTIKSKVRSELLGCYLNSDEIEQDLTSEQGLYLNAFPVEIEASELRDFSQNSTLALLSPSANFTDTLQLEDGYLRIRKADSYTASLVASFLRLKLLEAKISFSFETVMSHPDKVEVLERARSLGYRTYLYYVATEDSSINISRVANRVALGGHDVPEEKIVARYERSLANLPRAIRASDRAYIFDNSGSSVVWVAEITNGTQFDLKVSVIPRWFKIAVPD